MRERVKPRPPKAAQGVKSLQAYGSKEWGVETTLEMDSCMPFAAQYYNSLDIRTQT